ncbi:putative HK97 gp10 family phage protein [Azospirillaceae bacterium]
MGAFLDSLSFSDSSKRTENNDPKINIRRKMVAALDHQIALANAAQNGDTYTIDVEKWVLVDKASGTKERKKLTKAVRPMWFTDASDRVLLALRFANKEVRLNNKPSIVVGTMDKLVPTLQTIRKAVLQGEADAVLKAASDSRKRTLKLPQRNGIAQATKPGK